MLNRFGKHVLIALKCFIVIMKVNEMEIHENQYHVISKMRFRAL